MNLNIKFSKREMSFLPDLCTYNPRITNKSDIVIFDNFYTKDESKKIREILEGFEYTSYNNGKKRGVINQDKLADLISTSISSYLPYSLRDLWKMNGINPCFRWLIGDRGYYMSQHLDGNTLKDINTKSFYSVLIYLNDDTGGELVFPTLNITVSQKAGRLIVFNQNLIHYSKPCTEKKYFLHSELFYTRLSPQNDDYSKEAFELYLQSEKTVDVNEKNTLIEKACKLSSDFEEMYLG